MKPEDIPERWKLPLALFGLVAARERLQFEVRTISYSSARVFAERLGGCDSDEAGIDLLLADHLGGFSAIHVGLHIQEMMLQGEIVFPEPEHPSPKPFEFFARCILDFLDEVEQVYPEGLTIPPDRLK